MSNLGAITSCSADVLPVSEPPSSPDTLIPKVNSKHSPKTQLLHSQSPEPFVSSSSAFLYVHWYQHKDRSNNTGGGTFNTDTFTAFIPLTVKSGFIRFFLPSTHHKKEQQQQWFVRLYCLWSQSLMNVLMLQHKDSYLSRSLEKTNTDEPHYCTGTMSWSHFLSSFTFSWLNAPHYTIYSSWQTLPKNFTAQLIYTILKQL